MAAMWIWHCRRLGVDAPEVFTPSADIAGVAVGGATTPLAAALGLWISLIWGASARKVFTGGLSIGVFSWSMSQHLIMKLSRPRSVFNIR